VKRSRGAGWEGTFSETAVTLTPDDAFLIHEVIDDLNAIPQLKLRLLGHRQNRPE
jgi:hypothetical protein